MFKNLFSRQNKKGVIILILAAVLGGAWLVINGQFPEFIQNYLFPKDKTAVTIQKKK